MTRLLSSNQVFHQLNTLSRLDDHADTSLTTTTIARGDTSFDVTAAEGSKFTAGDDIRIDVNGDTAFITSVASVATDTITVDDPIGRAYAVGVTVTQLTPVDIGDLDENGIQWTTSGSETEVPIGTGRSVYLYIPGPITAGVTFNMRDLAPENIAVALGMDESDANIVHSGGIVAMLDDVTSLDFKPYKAEGVLVNGNAVTAYFHALKVVAPDANIQFAHGIASIVPFSGRLVSGVTLQIA